MRITIIGSGYVGLVTGTCLAEVGNRVHCIDINSDRIQNLKQGIVPIYEPGLEELIKKNYSENRLGFDTDLANHLDADIIFICVGTPPKVDGSADLQYVEAVATQIGKNINKNSIVVDKSTVPVGTADRVSCLINTELKSRNLSLDISVVSNPEFLKEGAAIDDFMRPDRIVIGTGCDKAREVMRQLYQPFNRNHDRTIFMGVRDAEMTKYTANAMLATKISFMNEIANICELYGVDVENVRNGIGSDSRIGYSFIYPGCGYGGSCFPKDVSAMHAMANNKNFDAQLLNAVINRNNIQKKILYKKLDSYFDGNLNNKTIAIWGLAFKPQTDDVREAASLELIKELVENDARIQVYDPIANHTAKIALEHMGVDQSNITYFDEPYAACEGADAFVLVTEWKPFRHPDFENIKNLLHGKLIIDGRNQYDPVTLKCMGFDYMGIGR